MRDNRIALTRTSSTLIALVVWLHSEDGSNTAAGLCVCCQRSCAIVDVVVTLVCSKTCCVHWAHWSGPQNRHVRLSGKKKKGWDKSQLSVNGFDRTLQTTTRATLPSCTYLSVLLRG